MAKKVNANGNATKNNNKGGKKVTKQPWIEKVSVYEEWRDHDKDNNEYKRKRAILDPIIAKHERGEELTPAEYMALVQCINVSVLTGKLEDYYAISTSVLMNSRCRARAMCDGIICKDCYAASGACRYSSLAQALEINYMILNRVLIPEEYWKFLSIPTTFGEDRIEAHGDTDSSICARNYIRIIRTHDHIDFGVWSKNLDHYDEAVTKEGKPSNMSFVYSSPKVNVPAEIPEKYAYFIDHRFTVYTREYALEHSIHINCGQYTEDLIKIDQRCKNCTRPCYHQGREFDIAEIKK